MSPMYITDHCPLSLSDIGCHLYITIIRLSKTECPVSAFVHCNRLMLTSPVYGTLSSQRRLGLAKHMLPSIVTARICIWS